MRLQVCGSKYLDKISDGELASFLYDAALAGNYICPGCEAPWEVAKFKGLQPEQKLAILKDSPKFKLTSWHAECWETLKGSSINLAELGFTQ